MSNWLFIDSSPDTYERLVHNKIPCIFMGIEKPHSTRGVAFPENDAEAVFDLLGMNRELYTYQPTDAAGVLYVKPAASVYLTNVGSGLTSESWAKIKATLIRYAVVLETDITFNNPHGHNAPSATGEGCLLIHCWSIPSGCPRRRYTLNKAFGVPLTEGQSDALKPTSLGVHIVDDDGNTVAEVVGSTIYILFDMVHNDNGLDVILSGILNKYAALRDDPEIIEKHMEEIRQRELSRVRRDYVRECDNRKMAQIRRCQLTLRSCDTTIAQAQQTMTESLRSREETLKLLAHYEAQESSTEEYEREYDKLIALPGVERVAVGDGRITVSTDPITITYTHDGETKDYDLGKFEILIPTNGNADGGRNGLQCLSSRQNDRNGLHHPHVQGNGVCCLGNLAEGVARLIAEYQFSVVAEVMIQFLNSFNPDDAYDSITKWPVKEGSES